MRLFTMSDPSSHGSMLTCAVIGFTVGLLLVGGGVGPHVMLPKVVLSSLENIPPLSFIMMPPLEMLYLPLP